MVVMGLSSISVEPRRSNTWMGERGKCRSFTLMPVSSLMLTALPDGLQVKDRTAQR